MALVSWPTQMRGGQPSELNLGLRLGDSMNFTVRGSCMAAFDDGASVPVQRRRVYLPGDVVVIRRRDHWDAHRFLGYAPSAHGLLALTQADDSDSRDPAAPAARVVGRAQCHVSVRQRWVAVHDYGRALIARVFGGTR